MLLKNWIITGIAVSAILAYIVGIPPSFSAEYSRTTQSTRSENSCGNTDADAANNGQPPSGQPPSGQPPSDYESFVDNTDNSQNADNTDDSTENTPTYCSNSNSQVQGDDNTALLSTVRP